MDAYVPRAVDVNYVTRLWVQSYYGVARHPSTTRRLFFYVGPVSYHRLYPRIEREEEYGTRMFEFAFSTVDEAVKFGKCVRNNLGYTDLNKGRWSIGSMDMIHTPSDNLPGVVEFVGFHCKFFEEKPGLCTARLFGRLYSSIRAKSVTTVASLKRLAFCAATTTPISVECVALVRSIEIDLSSRVY